MERYIKLLFNYNDTEFGGSFTSYKLYNSDSLETKEVTIVNNVKVKNESINDSSIIYWFDKMSCEKDGSYVKCQEVSKEEFYNNYNDQVGR